VIVLSGVHLKLYSRCLAGLIAVGLECGLVLILDDVDCNTMLVGELGDPYCALVPPYDAAAVLKQFDKCGGGGQCQRPSSLVSFSHPCLFML
jgi:hypothetical protein